MGQPRSDEIAAKIRISVAINFTINCNGGGQECPPHTYPKSESLQ
jgi:hypothetical protein